MLHAVGDAFADKAQGAVNQLKNNAGRADVPAERQFAGLDAYQKVLDSGIDVVILGDAPGFRPVQLAAAVEKNVHIFCEKPMAVDAPGVRSVMESVRKSKENGKALVAGFCWRYDYARREAFKRLMDGEIGDITSIYATYYTGPVKPMPPADAKPDGMSQTEWMVRNWYNFSWLGGDGLVEQAIHSVDKIMWAFGDQPPLTAVGSGGRVRPNHEGNIFDHFQVAYEFPNGIHAHMCSRQIPGCFGENADYIYGTKGVLFIGTWRGAAAIEDLERQQGLALPREGRSEHV
ncbi:MAG: Gfo/Idh/MocA family oxidoreductase [Verrucomicrobiales bacterium]